MSKPKPLPERGFLLECFSEPSARIGLLKWRARPRKHFLTVAAWKLWCSNFAGKWAGGVGEKGYLIVSIDRKHFYAHRIIFAINGGGSPEVVDHIDGGPRNQRLIKPISRSSENEHKRAQAAQT